MGKENYAGMKVLVMGLGLHGGGAASARFMARAGAEVTITDLQDEKALASSQEELEGLSGKTAFPLRYVLGRHETEDFRKADLVVKNPGVRPDSPYLKDTRRVETDISLFLAASPARLGAVSGTKGKSTTASALHWVLDEARKRGLLPGKARLGGNITVPPLDFLDSLGPEDDVVLELSSFQLGDLAGRKGEGGEALRKPRTAILTAFLRDHMTRYDDDMEAYVADKRVIYRGQGPEDLTVAGDDSWGRSFRRESRARTLARAGEPLPPGEAGGWPGGAGSPGFARLAPGAEPLEVLPGELLVPGRHQRGNLLSAALALLDLGLPPDFVRESLGCFPGIPHRLEFVHEARGIRFYNDSAATIPEAAAAAVEAFEPPPVLVAGGSDKRLDYRSLIPAAARARALILLGGEGTEKLLPLLRAEGLPFRGPFGTVEAAAEAALDAAGPGDTVVLSPGSASFGMFENEFDRGRRWMEAVRGLLV
jgi:UDP-N-acetylmuramoylalanine--D-glutamate ligase